MVRSKGVGVYFVTQNPIDIPDSGLSQLGNRVHTLCAPIRQRPEGGPGFAETFRQNPEFDTAGHHGTGRRRSACVGPGSQGGAVYR